MNKPVRVLRVILLCILSLLSASCGHISGENASSLSGGGSETGFEAAEPADVSVAEIKGELITDPAHLAGGSAGATEEGLSRQGACYKNSYFGIRFTLPSSWNFASDEQLAGMNRAACADSSSEPQESQPDGAGFWFDMYAVSDDGHQNVNVTIQNTRDSGVSSDGIESLVDSSLEPLRTALLAQGVTELTIKKDTAAFLGSQSPAIVVDGIISGIPLHETQVYSQKGSYILCATAVSYSEDRTASLLGIFSEV